MGFRVFKVWVNTYLLREAVKMSKQARKRWDSCFQMSTLGKWLRESKTNVLGSYWCNKTPQTKATWRRKVILLTLPYYSTYLKTGTWRSAAYWLVHHGLLSLLPCIPQVPVQGRHHLQWVGPLTSSINQDNSLRLAHRPIIWRHSS